MLRRLFWTTAETVEGLIIATPLLVMPIIFLLGGAFESDPIKNTLFCNDPCIVRNNDGGRAIRFMVAARAVLQGERDQVIIDGDCFSACALFADLARPKVCVTENVRFGFHRGRLELFDTLLLPWTFNPPHSKDVDDWVKAWGGYPEEGLNFMFAQDAVQFWPLCELHPPLPRSDPRRATQ